MVLPQTIIAGCDVILFSDDPNGDLMRLVKAVADGRLSQERVDEAVTRVLALKAALGLHRPQGDTDMAAAGRLVGSDESRRVAEAVTARVPTLVKDIRGLLPLSPARTPQRAGVLGRRVVLPFVPQPLPLSVPERLAREGFAVTVAPARHGSESQGFRPGALSLRRRDAVDPQPHLP